MAEQTNNGSNTVLVSRPTAGISTRNRWKEMEQTRQRMDALFGPVFGFPAFPRFTPTELMDKEPEVDIHETDVAYQVLASQPGYTQDQFKSRRPTLPCAYPANAKPWLTRTKPKHIATMAFPIPAVSRSPTRCPLRLIPTRSRPRSPTGYCN